MGWYSPAGAVRCRFDHSTRFITKPEEPVPLDRCRFIKQLAPPDQLCRPFRPQRFQTGIHRGLAAPAETVSGFQPWVGGLSALALMDVLA